MENECALPVMLALCVVTVAFTFLLAPIPCSQWRSPLLLVGVIQVVQSCFSLLRLCYRMALIITAHGHNVPPSLCQYYSCLLDQTLPDLNPVIMLTCVAITPSASANVHFTSSFRAAEMLTEVRARSLP